VEQIWDHGQPALSGQPSGELPDVIGDASEVRLDDDASAHR